MANKSEYASLNDLALSKGISHSELISETHDKILAAYKERYGKEAKTVEVVVNEKSGEVHLMQDGNDVTPGEFSSKAESIARQVIIDKLQTAKEEVPHAEEHIVENKEHVSHRNLSEVGKWIVNLIFWGYNLIYVFVIGLFLFNLLVNGGFRDSTWESIKIMGIFRFSFILTAALVPILTILIALRSIGRESYKKLGTLFFLFEVPLVAVSLMFAGIFNNPTPVMWFFFLMVIFSIPIFLMHIMGMKTKSTTSEYIELFLKEAVLLASSYLTLLFSFIVPIIFGGIATVVFAFFEDSLFSSSPYRYFNPLEFILGITFGAIMILIILALTLGPYLLTAYLGKIFLKSKRRLSKEIGREDINRAILIFGFVWIAVFLAASYQPDPDRYIERLSNLKETQDFEQREEIARELLDKEAQIKRTIEDMQNVRQRYLMTKDDDFIADAYEDVLNFNDFSAEMIQQTFMAMAYPFVYQGNLDNRYQALQNYEYLFGKSYYESTYPTTPVQESKQVILLSRRVDVEKDYEGVVAEVTIEEEYSNKTYRDQQIIYEFSLPPGSVVTDLKLGPDLEFQGIIAPKGAAETVYQREVNRQRDPALLEQTGPSQYRLRVFPIPSKNRSFNIQQDNQKVSFSYITPLDQEGYKLPVYSKKQNLDEAAADIDAYIDGERTDYAEFVKVPDPPELCANETIEVRSQVASVSAYMIPNSEVYDAECGDERIDLSAGADDLRAAIMIDVSYDNKENDQLDIVEEILQNNELIKNNTIELLKFNDILSDPIVLTTDKLDEALDLVYFGKSDWLSAANDLKGNYDFAILLTDSEDTTISRGSSLNQKIPLYIVDSEEITPYTTEITTAVLKSGGGTYSSFQEALNHAVINAMRNEYEGKELLEAGNYYSYYLDADSGLFDLENIGNFSVDTNDFAGQIMAKEYINKKIERKTGTISRQLEFLDQITNFAQNNEIITPYSSWIALVNQRQLDQLEREAQRLDRYKESTTTTPRQPIRNPVFESGPSGGGGGVSLFGGGMRQSPPAANGGAIDLGPQGQFSDLSPAAPGMGTFGGGLSSAFILINVLLLGGGILLFVVYKGYSYYKKRK